jgi:hypothetical protein
MENRGTQAVDAVEILPYASPYPMSAESSDRNMIEATVTGMKPLVLRLQDKTIVGLYGMLTEGVEGNVQFEMKRPSAELMKAISAMDD